MAKRSKMDIKSDEVIGTSDDSDSPPTKKTKAPKKKEAAPKAETSTSKAKAETSDSATGTKVQKNGDGESFVDLGGQKRVTVRKFKSAVLVDIREFYEDKTSGEAKPGKKGIALSPATWAALKEAGSFIDAEITKIS